MELRWEVEDLFMILWRRCGGGGDETHKEKDPDFEEAVSIHDSF